MLVFLDTEFTDFIDCELISIGLVSEDGQRELYLEIDDFERDKCNHYVQVNILDLLGRSIYVEGRQAQATAVPKRTLSTCLQGFFKALPRRVTIACDSEIDWGLLLDGLVERPANLVGRYDLRTLIDTPVFHRAVLNYHSHPDRPWHHALHDARAHRAGWMAYMDAAKHKR